MTEDRKAALRGPQLRSARNQRIRRCAMRMLYPSREEFAVVHGYVYPMLTTAEIAAAIKGTTEPQVRHVLNVLAKNGDIEKVTVDRHRIHYWRAAA